MTDLRLSRRAVTRALATLPIIAVPAIGRADAVPTGENAMNMHSTITSAKRPSATERQDSALLAAWAARQTALAVIESRGTYYDCEDHSPTEAEAFSDADEIIITTPARTLEGALARLWVGLSFCGNSWTERKAAMHNAIRRADPSQVRPFHHHMEIDQKMLFGTICDLLGTSAEG